MRVYGGCGSFAPVCGPCHVAYLPFTQWLMSTFCVACGLFPSPADFLLSQPVNCGPHSSGYVPCCLPSIIPMPSHLMYGAPSLPSHPRPSLSVSLVCRRCVNGACVCTDGCFTGANCSIPLNCGPNSYRCNKGKCDCKPCWTGPKCDIPRTWGTHKVLLLLFVRRCTGSCRERWLPRTFLANDLQAC